ncbi:hypothetical protein E2493_17820 [Sphingomonas parva]|uniref:Tetratricopeptide repeat protein n=1 Tax=Sphingomonas parva TaxID=2555898 RepID=A0A4Y8ZLN6_9SPHN|nr:hypothetical protein [Sphingomonas parva]TFI56923.1 hypothetical protein E2493_17820 [Sphingomonas parva]
MKFKTRASGLVLLAFASVALAQSPGSVESELKYAQEYMDAQKWDYAMWRYEGILRRDPDNAEARAGYEKARAAHEAKKARQEAQAREFDRPRPVPAPRVTPRSKGGGQSKPVSNAQAMCDAQFGTCNAIHKSVATCAPRRAMCYTQNGVK